MGPGKRRSKVTQPRLKSGFMPGRFTGHTQRWPSQARGKETSSATTAWASSVLLPYAARCTSVARRCACVAERGSEAVSSAPFPAVAVAREEEEEAAAAVTSARGTLHTGRWPEVAHGVPPGINDLTRNRSRCCRSGCQGRWFGGRAGRGLRRRQGQERRQAVREAGGAGAGAAAVALGAWGGRAVPGWASPGRRLPAAQFLAVGSDWRKPGLEPVMSE
ncbi:uncharacterized protein LOC123233972 [Gracilinanus agilis]|uniref:uncharacterized protein LOC123233972 n=1 Tax=Gracilinanus agilis TaxID=191870 RepID=UPI001CFD6F40|nr:uncharacterized protein LOC123233972 [Gracilinanus agilis]